jgi:hypothetical protein
LQPQVFLEKTIFLKKTREMRKRENSFKMQTPPDFEYNSDAALDYDFKSPNLDVELMLGAINQGM